MVGQLFCTKIRQLPTQEFVLKVGLKEPYSEVRLTLTELSPNNYMEYRALS